MSSYFAVGSPPPFGPEFAHGRTIVSVEENICKSECDMGGRSLTDGRGQDVFGIKHVPIAM